MPPKAFIKPLCWKIGCGCAHCLNLLLAILALLLTGLILLNNARREVPLPQGLIAWAIQKGIGQDLTASWSTAFFDLQGGLFLRDLRLTDVTSQELILEADSLSIDWAPVHLILGLFPPFDRLHLSGLRLYTPAQHSPSGLNEAVLHLHQAHLRVNQGDLIVDEGLLEWAGIHLDISGRGPLASLSGPRRQPNGLLLLPARLASLRPGVSPLGSADVRLRWSWNPDSGHRMAFLATAQEFTLPQAHLSNLLAQGDLALTETGPALTALDLSARWTHLDPDLLPLPLASLDWQLPASFSLSASGPLASTQWGSLPAQLRLLLHRPLSGPLPLRILQASADLRQPFPSFAWSLAGDKFFAQGHAHPLPSPPPGMPLPLQWSFRSYLHMTDLYDLFPNLPEHRILRQAGAQSLRFQGTFSPIDFFQGTLVCDHLYIGQTPFSRIHTQLSLSPSVLHLHRALIRKSAPEFASGSYRHHFPSSRFSLNASGSSFPHSLNSLLGKWWVQIFDQIEATQPLPADVTVWGFWRDEQSLQSLTLVEGEGGRYRGLDLPSMRVRVRSNWEWAHVQELVARFGERRITGSLAWRMGLGDDEPRPIQIAFRSNAAWPIARQASGVSALEEMELGGYPEISVSGVLWRPARNQAGAGETGIIPDLRFSLKGGPDSFEIMDLHLEAVQFDGQLQRSHLEVNNLTGIFAGGVLTGRLETRHWGEEGKQQRRLQLQLFDADYRATLLQLSSLMENPSTVRKSLLLEGSDSSGRLDADLDLHAGSDLLASHGEGRLTLRQGRIGQIHLLGGLSRTLSGVGLGFSTLELKAGSVEWVLENGQLTIPRGLLSGPVLNLQVSGQIDLQQQQLALQANAFFFRGLISKVLTPVSDNFQFDVTGPLDSPLWQLRLNPFRWIQNRFTDGFEMDNRR